MLAFPNLLIPAAEKAGIKIPPDASDYDAMEYPHFHVFCNAQLARRMTSPDEHWHNAGIIAAIPEDKIKTITLGELVRDYHLVTSVEV